MTTDTPASAPARRSTGRPAVLGAAAGCAVAAGAVVAIGALVAGSPGAAGAALGAGVTLATFLVGALVVDLVATAMPAAALGAALMTYTMQVGLLAVFFLVMNASGALDASISRTWLGIGVIVASVAWMSAQLAVVLTQRIPTYDLPDRAGDQ